MIGAGPAGIGVLLALSNRIVANRDDASAALEILQSLLVYEAMPSAGGKMSQYRVNANTSARDVVKGIPDNSPFVAIRDQYLRHPLTQARHIHLAKIGELMMQPLVGKLGELLGERLHCGIEVSRIKIQPDGFHSFNDKNRLLSVSQNLLLCCGAKELPLESLQAFQQRWEGSAQFLLRDDLQNLPRQRKNIVIVGASHSAFSCAWRLLYDPLFKDFAAQSEILVLQRHEQVKVRCTVEFAREHGLKFDPERDVDPVTGIVFKNGGLRKDAKSLYLRIRDGLELVKIEDLSDHPDLLQRADLILQAAGFSPNLPTIENANQKLEVGNSSNCGQLRDLASGEIIPGLFGMGLGIDNSDEGPARGEQSYKGSIHGFQSYPLAIGPLIVDQLIIDLDNRKSE